MKHYIVILCTTILYATGILTGLYYFDVFRQSIEQRQATTYREAQVLRVQSIGEEIETALNQTTKELKLHAERMLAAPPTSEDCNSTLQNLKYTSSTLLSNVFVVDADGAVVCANDQTVVQTSNPYIETTGHITGLLYRPVIEHGETPHVMTTLYTPLYSVEDIYQGTIASSFHIDNLIKKSIQPSLIHDHETLIAITKDHTILYHPNHSLIGTSLAASTMHNGSSDIVTTTPSSSSIQFSSPDGREHTGSVVHLTTPGDEQIHMLLSSPTEQIATSIEDEVASLKSVFLIFTAALSALAVLILISILHWNKKLRSEVDVKTDDLKKFKLAVDSVEDHVIIADSNKTIIYTNNAVQKISGYAPSDIMGKSIGSTEVWDGLTSSKHGKDFARKVITKKKPYALEVENTKKNGDKYYAALTASPILDEQGNVLYIIGIQRDITHSKEVDQAKSEFVSLASHQFRTPLSAINWYTELLLSGDAGDISKVQEQYLNDIHVSSKRMVDLVNSLLNVSRLELGTFIVQPEPTDILALLKEVLSELKVGIDEKKHTVNEDYDQLPDINVDPKLTRIIFQNLLSNAVKYTPENGIITVSVKKCPKGTEFNGKKFHTNMVTIAIVDNGLGIPKRQHHLLFQKLFRADNVKETDTDGTGLGLYIIKSIVEHSRGSVWFESEEGKGTSFFVALPISGMIQKHGSKRLEIHDNVQ